MTGYNIPKHEQLYSETLRAMANALQESDVISERMLNIDRFLLRNLIGYMAVKSNLSIQEMTHELDISVRTLARLTSRQEEMFIPMRKTTIDKVINYAYNSAEMNEQIG